MYQVTLSLPSLPPLAVRIAALDGAAELAADPADPGAALALVRRLGRDNSPGWLERLPVALFDRLCAAIFVQEFSGQIECKSACSECAEPFEFGFPLDALIAAQDQAMVAGAPVAAADGFWSIAGGIELRPPTLADLADRLDEPAFLARLVRAGQPDLAQVEAVLETAAPLLTLPIATPCPHCSAEQQIQFDMARFLVDTIAAERPFLIRETHLIASRYGWDHASICALPRRDRQAYAALIESERSAALKWRAG